jgi:hypothetical protein
MVIEVTDSKEWEQPPLPRPRTTSAYERAKFGMENDPEEEHRLKLEAIREAKEARLAAEEAERKRIEEENNTSIFGWLGKAVTTAVALTTGRKAEPEVRKVATPVMSPQQRRVSHKASIAMAVSSSESSSSESESSDGDGSSSSSDGEDSESDGENSIKPIPPPDDKESLVEQLNKKEVLALPTVEQTMRMMARGDYFTFLYVNDQAGTSRVAVSLSVHNHRRISTFDMQSMARDERAKMQRMGSGGQPEYEEPDEEEGNPLTSNSNLSGTGVNPFFVPAPHSKPVLTKDVFMWVEFPRGLAAGKNQPPGSAVYPPDVISNTTKDARGRAIKNLKLSAVRGGSSEIYKITNSNVLTFLEGATAYWCEAQKPPAAPKGTPPYTGPPEDNPYPTHMLHPRRFKTRAREQLEQRHQQRIKREDQKLPVLDVIDLYTGKKSFALLSTQILATPPEVCFTLASKENSLSFTTENAHLYKLKPYQKQPSKKQLEREQALDAKGRIALAEAKVARLKSQQFHSACKQRDAWLLGFASLLSVGRNLVKHRIERAAATGDKILQVARSKLRKKLRLALSGPKASGAILVRDAATVMKTGVYAKRYHVETHAAGNEITDQQQQNTRANPRGNTRKESSASSPGGGTAGEDELAPNHLDSVRRILHYEEVFVWVEFPNDPEVKELPDTVHRDSLTSSHLLSLKSARAMTGGMSATPDEELDMYGAAFYWCDPAEAHLRPRNPSQAIFFSQLEDIYIGKKTEAFVFEHVDPNLCLSLYTPTIVLDLQMETAPFRNLWVKSILALLQIHRVIGAKKEDDADNSFIQIPKHLLQIERKASQAGMTPVWLHRRTVSRDSLYGSFSFNAPGGLVASPSGITPRASQFSSPKSQHRGMRSPMTPLSLPSPAGVTFSPSGGGSGSNLSSPTSRNRSASDLDLTLTRPASLAMLGRKASDGLGERPGQGETIVEEEETKEDAEEKDDGGGRGGGGSHAIEMPEEEKQQPAPASDKPVMVPHPLRMNSTPKKSNRRTK